MPINQSSHLEIASNKRQILHSGSVHTYDESSLQFTVGNLQITFSFAENGNKPDMDINIKSETLLEINLQNFSNPTGIGTDSPINLGIMGGRQLSLAFTVQALSKESIKLLSYTFFLGEKV
ncbi:DUF6864 domain-containing function [Desulfovibrio sp. DV]|uniref:DUF6864 domain-containing function n=1 Tax=Desulfovibrio sp. DV TaxID=1844708 RepID=UPI000A469E0F|nr:hypothetical protein [Desulfovibrio sp. DV]